jgi:hypothetical protein
MHVEAHHDFTPYHAYLLQSKIPSLGTSSLQTSILVGLQTCPARGKSMRHLLHIMTPY